MSGAPVGSVNDFAVEPPRRPAEDGVEVTVWGQSFPNDAQIVFDPPLRAPNQQRQGTYRCGQIVATLQSPPNETRTYTVTVKSERIGTIPSDQPIELELTEIATS